MNKPCPFCGNAGVEMVIIDCEDREGTPWPFGVIAAKRWVPGYM